MPNVVSNVTGKNVVYRHRVTFSVSRFLTFPKNEDIFRHYVGVEISGGEGVG